MKKLKFLNLLVLACVGVVLLSAFKGGKNNTEAAPPSLLEVCVDNSSEKEVLLDDCTSNKEMVSLKVEEENIACQFFARRDRAANLRECERIFRRTGNRSAASVCRTAARNTFEFAIQRCRR